MINLNVKEDVLHPHLIYTHTKNIIQNNLNHQKNKDRIK